MKRSLLLAGLLAGLPAMALAQGRPSTTAMSCAAARGFVLQRGAVVLGTGGDTYERIVRDNSFCAYGQRLRPLFAPTRDSANCYVGDYCFDESLDPR